MGGGLVLSNTGSFSLKQAYCGLHNKHARHLPAGKARTAALTYRYIGRLWPSLCVILSVGKNHLSRLVRPFTLLKYSKNINYLSLPVVITAIFFIFIDRLPVHAQEVQGLDVTINEVDGDVEIMLPNTFQWIPVPAEGGSMFSEGIQIRTGPFSSISLVLADSSVVLVDSFTFMTVEKFFKTGNVVTTRLNLIVGSIVNTLNEGTPFENDYKVVTPSFTTSLRDSEIKKVVAGAMFKDTVRTGYREDGQAERARTGYRKQESAGEIAREKQRLREASVSQP